MTLDHRLFRVVPGSTEQPKSEVVLVPLAEGQPKVQEQETSLVGLGCSRNNLPEQPQAEDSQSRARSAAPIVKWCGGKGRLLPELLQRVPPRYGRYYEPFAGGAALFFRLAPERTVLGDANADLIIAYRAVVHDVEHVIDLLRGHQVLHSESHYYATRDAFNRAALPLLERAAAFIYLNKTCFNGLWRVNSRGEMNVPMGAYKNPAICTPGALRAAGEALRGADLRAGDYRDCVHDAKECDLVYFDPPYDAAFNAYTPGGAFDQERLAETARALAVRGCHVIVSNSDTPRIRALYQDFQIERVKAARSVNADAAGRGDVDELIITNRRSKTMGQTWIPGTEPADRIEKVEEAIYDYLNAKTEQSRVTLEARGITKTKHGKVEALFGEHKLDSHPYTCPKTGKLKRFWFTTEKKAKGSTVATPRAPRRGKRGGPRRDIDAEIAGEQEHKEDTKIEMRRVPRKSVEKEIDGFGSVRERMEQKQADAAKQTKKAKRSKGKPS